MNGTVRDLLRVRSRDYTDGLKEDRRMTESVIPFWEMHGKKLSSLTLMPIEIVTEGKKSDIGLPRKAKNYGMIDRLSEMSAKYGIKMTIRGDGTGSCDWQR